MTARFLAIVGALACSVEAKARKFYPDDPLSREPAPIRIEKARRRKISDYYDVVRHTLTTPGDKRQVRAQDINTIDEVMDGAWYEKRHARRRMTIDQLKAGPGTDMAPAEGTWSVVSAKTEGITPGFVVRDSQNRQYFLKFDPVGNPEIATAADVIGSKLFHALGYHVPQNYIVHFRRDRLRVQPGAKFRDERGRERELGWRELNEILLRTPLGPHRQFRATASLMVPGEPLGPYRYFGTRSDDPNDTIPHEHRRSLRALHVFSAWVGHDDSRAINTLDTLIDGYVKHYLIDFGSIFGSASSGANSPRSGFEYLFNWNNAAKEFFTFGAWTPSWARINYPAFPSIGRFSAEQFEPEEWVPEYPNPAFLHRDGADTFWAAEQVAAFSDDEVRALVSTGEYSDSNAGDYLARTLIARRDAIVRAYLHKPLALTDIRLENGRVMFRDLSPKEDPIQFQWFDFDNGSDRLNPIAGGTSAGMPPTQSQFVALALTAAGNEKRRITVYWKQTGVAYQMVGLERAFK